MKPSCDAYGVLVVNVLDAKLLTGHLRQNGPEILFAIKNNLDINMVVSRKRIEKNAEESCYALENESF